MNKLKLQLEHCYGIRKLDVVLEFAGTSAVAIYAPNGAMKSSLANTFQDIADGKQSRDRIFPHRATTRVVQNENNVDLPAGDVIVLRPYEEFASKGDGTATLLVNAALRQEYEALHAGVTSARSALVSALKTTAKTKRPVDREVLSTFMPSGGEFDAALASLKDELDKDWEPVLKDVPYDVMNDERVVAFLANADFRASIDDYTKKYNELLAASKYFRKGGFNYYEATNVAKELKSSGFFKAKHSVSLNGDEKQEITSEAELQALIDAERAKISEDAALRTKYEALEKQIQKNAQLREFEAYLQSHEELLPELADPAALKKKLWMAYLKVNHAMCADLLSKVDQAAVRSAEIEAQAAQEHTQWQAVIDIFNTRFIVPFHLEVANKVQVVLGKDTAPRLGFVFKDGNDHAPVERDALLQTLSTGEKKAFHVLNMLFDIEMRRSAGQETLLIVDDIADSFDYKNKYAIIQYLSDLAEDQHFKLLILTHNFDFYRTIESRNLVSRKNCFMVSKTSAGVTLEAAQGVRNVFSNVWKPGFFKEDRKKICCIPFMRNLIEYTKGVNDTDYLCLTSLLHWKADTAQITVAELDAIYINLFGITGQSTNGATTIVDVLATEAAACLQAADGINFENKVVLAIATRLRAESFMAAKINDAVWLASITANQTPALLKRYQNQFPADTENLCVIQRVLLMTPENIHLNSFMYEPILDMSDHHLRHLYSEVVAMA
ncbi:phage infection protein [Hydrogenophaga crassostreae]|uniref:Phage infection protein n=1 Tax=Hydrogenophaga crassostreae TaxID=1763535 RepID=A0A167IIQ2_9BURK|nr:AAA family ATPase [Hydrogenophaga crassostreae]AOW14180.1 phage infection protein [Hydrogenophaga crassostreae]OAD42890.1 phage infection protein [Hydrogenophaga crassostreae]